MQQLIDYYCGMLNIKADNEFVLADMMCELDKINAIDAQNDFREFVKSKINDYDLQYNTGLQKFMLLSGKFIKNKKIELNKDRLEKASETAKELAQKVKAIPAKYETQPFEAFMLDKQTPYFSTFEIKCLNKIGNVVNCKNLQRSISGTDALAEKLDSIISNIVLETHTKHAIERTTPKATNVSSLINKSFKRL